MGACQSAAHDPAADISGDLAEFKKELAVTNESKCDDNASAEIIPKRKRSSKSNRSLNASAHTASTVKSARSLGGKDCSCSEDVELFDSIVVPEAKHGSVHKETKKEKSKKKRKSSRDEGTLQKTAAAIAMGMTLEDNSSHDKRCSLERSESFAARVTSCRKCAPKTVFITEDSMSTFMLEG